MADQEQTLRCRSGFRLRILTPVRAKPARTGDPDSRYAHARITTQIVKERWFLLPGQPQSCNNKAYCNNIIMYLSRRIHPEIPGGDGG
jgi:hypothetical protein